MASNDDIMRAIGGLEATVSALDTRIQRFEQEFSVERASSSKSRRDIHDRIDEQSYRIGEAEKTVIASGAITAQQRDVIVGLTTAINEDIKPTVDQVKDITRLGRAASVLFIGLGFTAGGFMIATWDIMRPWLAKFLLR